MPTTYTNGLKLPDLGSIDWYNSYKNNIDILDPIVGTVNGVATTYAPISHNHSASEITSGTIDIARLPPAALERMHIVADQTARYALTTSTVQEGDTVKQTDTGVMYLVVDSTKLNSADGYTEYSAGTASKAIADEDGTSIKTGYMNVAGNQTVSGNKEFTGSNTFNNILPNATNTYSLGSSSYQWSSVYAQSYYYNGTAWGLDKNNVWTQDQTTTATLYVKSTTWERGVEPSSSSHKDIYFTDKNNAVVGAIRRLISNGSQNIEVFGATSVKDGQLDPTGTSAIWGFSQTFNSDGSTYFSFSGNIGNSIVPKVNNSYDLGTSSNKWKTLNGINPGALGIPDKDNMVNIASEFTDLTGGFNYYIPPADGFVSINADTDVYCAVVSSTHNTAFWRQSAVATSTGYASVTIPVRAGLHLQAKIKSTVAIYAAFFPCLGNV